MADVLSASHFHDDKAAASLLESIRWSDGRACPHCGTLDRSYATKRTQKNSATVYRCGGPTCRKDFTVTTKSVMEASHIDLHKWMQGFYLMASSKKGISAHQLHRSLGITYKAAWFMAHRIREAMRAGGLDPLGSGGGTVEVDETYYGQVEQRKRRDTTTKGQPFLKPMSKRGRRGGPANKRAIVALVERGGEVRTFHVPTADKLSVTKIVTANVAREASLYTDESRLYGDVAAHVAAHETVKHSAGEYVRYEDDRTIHTNTVENVFSVFKRGMRGVYQHCDEKHLHRYLAEFAFRYNRRTALGVSDLERTVAAVKAAEGKRLPYRQPH
ncbi:MAG: IS1595 family transposase [Bauldia sp.]